MGVKLRRNSARQTGNSTQPEACRPPDTGADAINQVQTAKGTEQHFITQTRLTWTTRETRSLRARGQP